MSSVVWGPPMLGIGVVFATVALLVALAVIRLLKVGGAYHFAKLANVAFTV